MPGVQSPQRRLFSLHALLRTFFVLLLVGVILPVTGRPLAAKHTENEHTSTSPQVVRIRADTADKTRQLAVRGIDLLARDGDDLFALVSSAEQADLIAEGWDVRVVADQTARLREASPQLFQAGYRTVEETELFMQTMATQYAHLATLVDIGDSWQYQQTEGVQGYNLWALRLTNKAIAGPKPTLFLMAALHARELTTAEIATRFIDYLLTNYGIVADVTWLLNEHEIVVVPMANPDGRKLAEQGFSQRKNINHTNSMNCAFPPQSWSQAGVDLNRNFAFGWGTVNSIENTLPCFLVYPGTAPASEPETQALQTFIQSLFPANVRPGDGVAAPATTAGVLISLHSYSDLVLWPWGYSEEPPPNATGLAQLGQRMAAYNGYVPQQATYLYPTSGTTDDWSYAELGIASYTFEIGSTMGACSGFMPPYACLDGYDGRSFWNENLPALLYAARVARAPYLQPSGPDVSDMWATFDQNQLTLHAALDGQAQPVIAAELYIGQSPWRGGTPVALQPDDGLFDSASEQGHLILAMDESLYQSLTAETPPLLFIRSQNSSGIWGPISTMWATRMTKQVWLPLVMQIQE